MNHQSMPANVGSNDGLGMVTERAELGVDWPVVKITVAADGHIAGASFYAPGLPPGVHDFPPGVHDLWCVPVNSKAEIGRLREENTAWRRQCDTLTHQVICCGVAASHPDATLTTRGAYAGQWNSAQAEEVRKLRAERDALSRQLDQIIEG